MRVCMKRSLSRRRNEDGRYFESHFRSVLNVVVLPSLECARPRSNAEAANGAPSRKRPPKGKGGRDDARESPYFPSPSSVRRRIERRRLSVPSASPTSVSDIAAFLQGKTSIVHSGVEIMIACRAKKADVDVACLPRRRCHLRC